MYPRFYEPMAGTEHISERLTHLRRLFQQIQGLPDNRAAPTIGVEGLRLQIRLREIALRDIQVIRSRLRPLFRGCCHQSFLLSRSAKRRPNATVRGYRKAAGLRSQ